MPAPQGPPPPGKKTKKEKQRERKAAAGTTAVPTTGQKVGEAASQKRRADSGSDDKPAKAAKTEEAANAGRRLFVGHCPQSLTEDGVRKLFETCGDCDVEMVQRPNGRFKGICFVTFETAKAATAALKLDGSELDGKKVVVQLASAPTGSKEEQPEAAPSPSVFVANLAAGTDKAAVRGVMREFGTIKGVTLIQKAEGHAAFVDFETTEEASKAVAAKSFARPLPAQRGQSGHQLAAAAHAAIHPPLQRPRPRDQATFWAREMRALAAWVPKKSCSGWPSGVADMSPTVLPFHRAGRAARRASPSRGEQASTRRRRRRTAARAAARRPRCGAMWITAAQRLRPIRPPARPASTRSSSGRPPASASLGQPRPASANWQICWLASHTGRVSHIGAAEG